MTQIELANMAARQDFQGRINYLMVKAAVAKLNGEAPSAADKLLGQSILDAREPLLPWALGALGNPSIAAGAHASDGSTISDGDLEFAVNSLWPAFAL